MSEEKEISLFDAPDLAALQRNWPRIALRASVLVLVPFFVTMLARSLDLYPTIARLPLPLDFLDVGPLAYEGKVVFAIVATLLSLAFLIPKRTAAFVMAICVGGILWTGHVYITLQWARLFATRFAFRADAAPEPLAWIFAALLMTVGVVFLLLENLLDTRQQQEERHLARDQTRALFDVAWRTLALMIGIGGGLAIALLLAYAGMRAALSSARLPFRLNPVIVLFTMGVCLAVLLAVAARRRAPVAHAAWMSAQPTPAPARLAPTPVPVATLDEPALATAKTGPWARMRRAERVAFVLALIAIPATMLPFTSYRPAFGGYAMQPGIASLQGTAILAAAIATLAIYVSRLEGNGRRLGPGAAWGVALATFPLLLVRVWRTSFDGGTVLEVGAFVGFLIALTSLSTTLFAARRP